MSLPPFDGRRQPAPVVGLDLSLTGTGIATATGTRIVKTDGRADATLLERRTRLAGITATIGLHVAEAAAATGQHRGALVVLEGPSLAQQAQRGTHDRAGLWWLVVDELLGAGHLVVEVTPAGVKRFATGKGNANKTAIAVALAIRYGVEFPDDNQADAYVLRAMGLHRLGCLLAPVPQTHTDALKAVAWPTAEQLEQLELGVHVPGQLVLA